MCQCFHIVFIYPMPHLLRLRKQILPHAQLQNIGTFIVRILEKAAVLSWNPTVYAKTQNTPLTRDHNYRDREYSYKVVWRFITKSREVSKPWDWVSNSGIYQQCCQSACQIKKKNQTTLNPYLAASRLRAIWWWDASWIEALEWISQDLKRLQSFGGNLLFYRFHVACVCSPIKRRPYRSNKTEIGTEWLLSPLPYKLDGA